MDESVGCYMGPCMGGCSTSRALLVSSLLYTQRVPLCICMSVCTCACMYVRMYVGREVGRLASSDHIYIYIYSMYISVCIDMFQRLEYFDP